jgi:hypothetical protein
MIDANMGTRRFQRAVSSGVALGSNEPSNRDCALEAMRTYGAPPDLFTGFIYFPGPLRLPDIP